MGRGEGKRKPLTHTGSWLRQITALREMLDARIPGNKIYLRVDDSAEKIETEAGIGLSYFELTSEGLAPTSGAPDLIRGPVVGPSSSGGTIAHMLPNPLFKGAGPFRLRIMLTDSFGGLIGYGQLEDASERNTMKTYIHVEEGWRKQGWGKALLETVISFAVVRNVTTLQAVADVNSRAWAVANEFTSAGARVNLALDVSKLDEVVAAGHIEAARAAGVRVTTLFKFLHGYNAREKQAKLSALYALDCVCVANEPGNLAPISEDLFVQLLTGETARTDLTTVALLEEKVLGLNVVSIRVDGNLEIYATDVSPNTDLPIAAALALGSAVRAREVGLHTLSAELDADEVELQQAYKHVGFTMAENEEQLTRRL